MFTRGDVLCSTRMAGQVKRYHTWPAITQQTVAEHCYHCMRIYYEIWHELPPQVAAYVLYHDSGELVTGDLPYPVKKNNPDLKAAADRVEALALETLGVKLPDLDRLEKNRVKACDLIEMLEYGFYELRLGNKLATPIIVDIWDNLQAFVKEHLAPIDALRISAYTQQTLAAGTTEPSSVPPELPSHLRLVE